MPLPPVPAPSSGDLNQYALSQVLAPWLVDSYGLVEDGTVVTNTTVETASWFQTIPASYWQPGQSIDLRFIVKCTGVTGTPTLTPRVRLGPSVGSSLVLATVTMASVAANDYAIFDITLQVQDPGASSTARNGGISVKSLAGTSTVAGVYTEPAFDATVSNVVGVSLEWGAASASNTAKVTLASIAIRRQRP